MMSAQNSSTKSIYQFGQMPLGQPLNTFTIDPKLFGKPMFSSTYETKNSNLLLFGQSSPFEQPLTEETKNSKISPFKQPSTAETKNSNTSPFGQPLTAENKLFEKPMASSIYESKNLFR